VCLLPVQCALLSCSSVRWPRTPSAGPRLATLSCCLRRKRRRRVRGGPVAPLPPMAQGTRPTAPPRPSQRKWCPAWRCPTLGWPSRWRPSAAWLARRAVWCAGCRHPPGPDRVGPARGRSLWRSVPYCSLSPPCVSCSPSCAQGRGRGGGGGLGGEGKVCAGETPPIRTSKSKCATTSGSPSGCSIELHAFS
jgi:hypothetical protein